LRLVKLDGKSIAPFSSSQSYIPAFILIHLVVCVTPCRSPVSLKYNIRESLDAPGAKLVTLVLFPSLP
jgi:hypothetical protein